MTQAEALEAELLEVAREAALAGAAELAPRFGRNASLRTKTTPTDLVSDADLAAEAAVHAVLRERRPGDAVLAEETGLSGGSGSHSGVRWLVDPLDGTVNFVFGIPAFAVSVACEDAVGPLAGVVFDPTREECFQATRSGPATLNGEEIVAGERASDLSMAMVATGFGYDAAMRARQAAVVSRVLPRARDIRRVGSAALDLCWTACGRFDAYYERGLNAWDLAAGSLIAERSGLEVRVIPSFGEDPPGVIAAPAALVDELRELVES
jgi:myo-inositol-1(or 4)-monophosphatase